MTVEIVGPAPGGVSHYLFEQPLPATVWTIDHNLGRRPAGVHVEDTEGADIEGEVRHVDNNTTVLTFSAAFAGKAQLI